MSSLANDTPLLEKMKALDTALFETFNNCQNSEELEKHASYFSPDVEFYHDNGGVTWDRDSMIANTKKMRAVIIPVNLLRVLSKPTQSKVSVQSLKGYMFFVKIKLKNVKEKLTLLWFGVM
jgi:hypothetical protein